MVMLSVDFLETSLFYLGAQVLGAGGGRRLRRPGGAGASAPSLERCPSEAAIVLFMGQVGRWKSS